MDIFFSEVNMNLFNEKAKYFYLQEIHNLLMDESFIKDKFKTREKEEVSLYIFLMVKEAIINHVFTNKGYKIKVSVNRDKCSFYTYIGDILQKKTIVNIYCEDIYDDLLKEGFLNEL